MICNLFFLNGKMFQFSAHKTRNNLEGNTNRISKKKLEDNPNRCGASSIVQSKPNVFALTTKAVIEIKVYQNINNRQK